MESVGLLLQGFEQALKPELLLYALIGCAIGMLTGVLPGFGSSAATALLLPVTFTLDPTGAIIMLLGIYYGTMYGGTITSVLLNVPGESASVVTAIEGYRMAKRGHAGKALAISAYGSFIGGFFALIGMLLTTGLARYALQITSLQLFWLLFLSLSLVMVFAGKSLTKAFVSAALGLFIGTIGLDPLFGTQRFTGGSVELLSGINYIPIVMGLFGASEVLRSMSFKETVVKLLPVGSTFLTWADFRLSLPAIIRGTLIGFPFGLVPGSPSVACTFASYAAEKRWAKDRDQFGKGAISGVAGPETANNSMQISAMVPLLTFGIPSGSTTAIILGAFLIHGLQPGPLLYRDHPDIAWGIIAGLFVSNFILLIMSLPAVRIWVLILKVPYGILGAATLAIMTIGAYTINNSALDVGILWLCGLMGLLFRKLDIPLTPMALTLVLGPVLEQKFRTALSVDPSPVHFFVGDLFAASCLALMIVILVAKVVSVRPRRVSRRQLEIELQD